MSSPELDRVPRLRRSVRYRLVEGQAVVIVQDAGEALVLNEVGSRFLELVDGRRSLAEIVARMADEYPVEPEELRRDLESYLAELIDAGIVRFGRGENDTTGDGG